MCGNGQLICGTRRTLYQTKKILILNELKKVVPTCVTNPIATDIVVPRDHKIHKTAPLEIWDFGVLEALIEN